MILLVSDQEFCIECATLVFTLDNITYSIRVQVDTMIVLVLDLELCNQYATLASTLDNITNFRQ